MQEPLNKQLSEAEEQKLLQTIQKPLKIYKDFPVQGVNFADFFSILSSPQAFDALYILTKAKIDQFLKKRGQTFNAIVGLETRGFLLGSLLAKDYKVPFVPVRKPNKLPAKVVSMEYNLQYGSGKIQIQQHALNQSNNVIILDDLIATGGTLWASGELVKKLGAKIVMYHCTIRVKELNGEKLLPQPEKLMTLFDI